MQLEHCSITKTTRQISQKLFLEIQNDGVLHIDMVISQKDLKPPFITGIAMHIVKLQNLGITIYQIPNAHLHFRQWTLFGIPLPIHEAIQKIHNLSRFFK